MLPNFASILPEYANVTQDDISQAFRTGNHRALRDLPNNLSAEEVYAAKLRAMEKAREAAKPRGKPAASLKGMFQEFEYVPSRYDLQEELRTKERLEKQAKRLEVSGVEFRPAAVGAALKHEDPFTTDEYRFPHLAAPFDAEEEVRRRRKWLQDSKAIHGPFVPSGITKPLEQASKHLLPETIRSLHAHLVADWGDAQFAVMATEDDHIVIRFALESLDSRKGLLAYMNRFADSGDLPARYSLRRVIEDWNATPGDDFVYFVFRPPWVRAGHTEAYYSLHPEQSTARRAVETAATSRASARSAAE